MDDAARVRGREGIGDGNGDPQRFASRMPCRGISASRLLPRTYSITMKSCAVGGLDFVNRDDVRMIERRRGVCFLDEATTAILVGDPIGGQHLDRDVALEPRIARAIDLAHAPGAD